MSSTLLGTDSERTASPVSALPGFAYRPLSIMAVVAFFLGLLSAATSLLWFMLIVPAFNLLLGGIAYLRIRAARGDLGGSKLAACGWTLSALSLVGGIGYQWYIYQAEVPADFTRISFSKDISDRAARMMDGSASVGAQLEALDGKKVFVKGFMYPGDRQTGLSSFLLVKDSGICCFGKEPAVTDMVGVYMNGLSTANYFSGRVSVAGTFRLNRQYSGASKLEPLFTIDGESVAVSRSDFEPSEQTEFTSSPPASEAEGSGDRGASSPKA